MSVKTMLSRRLLLGGLLLLPLGAVAGGLLDSAVLTELNGKPASFARYQGKTTVVNFWATWCGPCRKEMPLLSALAPRLAARQVRFVGIALDQPGEVAAYLKQLPVSYPVLMSDGEGIALMRALGNRSGGLPFTVVLDEQGRPLARIAGLVSEAELMKALPLR